MNSIEACQATILRFFQAMRDWETYAFTHPLENADTLSARAQFRADVTGRLRGLFDSFCADDCASRGREEILRYCEPPEYADDRISITELEEHEPGRVHVTVTFAQPLDTKQARFELTRTDDTWRIASRENVDARGVTEVADL